MPFSLEKKMDVLVSACFQHIEGLVKIFTNTFGFVGVSTNYHGNRPLIHLAQYRRAGIHFRNRFVQPGCVQFHGRVAFGDAIQGRANGVHEVIRVPIAGRFIFDNVRVT